MIKILLVVVIVAYSIEGLCRFLDWKEGRIPDRLLYGPLSNKE